MRWHVFAVGKLKVDFARFGIEEYVARLRPFVPVKIEFIKASSPPIESMRLLERTRAMFRIVLDERGEHVASRELVKKIAVWERCSKRDVALIVGAPMATPMKCVKRLAGCGR